MDPMSIHESLQGRFIQHSVAILPSEDESGYRSSASIKKVIQ